MALLLAGLASSLTQPVLHAQQSAWQPTRMPAQTRAQHISSAPITRPVVAVSNYHNGAMVESASHAVRVSDHPPSPNENQTGRVLRWKSQEPVATSPNSNELATRAQASDGRFSAQNVFDERRVHHPGDNPLRAADSAVQLAQHQEPLPSDYNNNPFVDDVPPAPRMMPPMNPPAMNPTSPTHQGLPVFDDTPAYRQASPVAPQQSRAYASQGQTYRQAPPSYQPSTSANSPGASVRPPVSVATPRPTAVYQQEPTTPPGGLDLPRGEFGVPQQEPGFSPSDLTLPPSEIESLNLPPDLQDSEMQQIAPPLPDPLDEPEPAPVPGNTIPDPRDQESEMRANPFSDNDAANTRGQFDFEDDSDLALPGPDDIAGSITCNELRERVRSRPLTEVSLDVSPNYGEGMRSVRKDTEQERLEFAANSRVRDWTNYRGERIATGRLIDLRNDKVVLDIDGREREIAVNDLSDSDIAYVGDAWNIPLKCGTGNDAYAGRSFVPASVQWKAPGHCHKPLYFDEVQLERYGHDAGPVVQPLISTAHFFANIAVLPYKMGIHPPHECQYSLGYIRPGNCAPYMLQPIPISLRGAAVQAGVVSGAAALIP